MNTWGMYIVIKQEINSKTPMKGKYEYISQMHYE